MLLLKKLAKHTKAEYILHFNPQKGYYQTVEEYVKEMKPTIVGDLYFDKDLWYLQLYPMTPVGFVNGVSNNLNALIKWGIQAAKDY